jgi:lipopolysaccharide transport system ATP-binding protein
MPVRTYSAGMSVRLAFGVSTAFRPRYCSWTNGFRLRRPVPGESAQTDVGSHRRLQHHGARLALDAAAVEWCNRGMFLEQGRVLVNGTIDEAIAAYQTSPDAANASRRR